MKVIAFILFGTTLLAQTPGFHLKVPREIQERQLVRRVEPVYPEEAKARGIHGIVTVEIFIGVDGHVKSAKVISGHALLKKVALDAVMQWVYRPTIYKNAPVEVLTTDYVVVDTTTPALRATPPFQGGETFNLSGILPPVSAWFSFRETSSEP